MMGAVRWTGVLSLCVLLCGVSWAGNVQVSVTEGGAPVAGANVRIDPGAITGTTNVQGKWVAPGVAAGDATVMAWTETGGVLRGAVANVTVPAAGNAGADLSLVRAIWLHQYLPRAVGNRWQYDHRRSETGGATSRGTRREHVDRPTTVNGAPAVVLVATNDGVFEWEEIQACDSNGFVMYTQQHGPDTIKFEPPLRCGPLLPLGYEWTSSGVGKHSDGSPDTRMTFRCKLEGFQDVRVPAGDFPESARVAVTFVAAGETDQITAWMARGVGIVREIGKNPARTNTKLLEEYSMRGLAPRPIAPIRPIGPRRPAMP